MRKKMRHTIRNTGWRAVRYDGSGENRRMSARSGIMDAIFCRRAHWEIRYWVKYRDGRCYNARPNAARTCQKQSLWFFQNTNVSGAKLRNIRRSGAQRAWLRSKLWQKLSTTCQGGGTAPGTIILADLKASAVSITDFQSSEIRLYTQNIQNSKSIDSDIQDSKRVLTGGKCTREDNFPRIVR